MQSSDNAVESDTASSESKSTAEKGKTVVEQMVASMEAINRSNDRIVSAVNASNQNVSEIVQVIQEIESKTKVINDIVFQTKLLSFNASVEAARAGEQGKGFAVVAEEVGNLAQMSGNAAKEISVLLCKSIKKVEAIVQETKTTVDELMSTSKETVNRGTQVAHECEGVLSQIVTSSGEVSTLVSQIAVASREQSNGVTEISIAMQQIDQSTHVGVRSATACAAAAEQMAAKVKELRESSSTLRKTLTGKITMNKFKWAKEYILGVPEMDNEHQILIEKMNHLSDVLGISNQKERSAAMKAAFADLVDFTVQHFAHEENFQQSIGYPDFKKHKEIHEILLAKVSKFGPQIDDNTVNGSELMDFVNDWLMRHILGNDKQYAHYFKRSGKSASQSERRFDDAA